MNEKRFYVYEWYLKSTGEVFHVGKGTGDRYKNKSTHRNAYFKNIINKYKDEADVRIVLDNLTEQEAWDAERKLIAEYKEKGQCKTNFHEGGRGGYTGNYNSAERSRKISQALSGKIRARGAENPLYGCPLSEEHKRHLSEALKGKPKTAEHKAKIGLASKRNWTPEVQQRLQSCRQQMLDSLSPEEKFNMVKHLCIYEYQIYFNNEQVYADIGYDKMVSFCKEQYDISRTIIEKIIKGTWKPTFKKHKPLESLKILKIKRCID